MKKVLITGASKGIGEKLALKYLKEGYFVINLSRSAPKYDISKHITCDITDSKNLDLAFEIIDEEIGGIDLLINNAGLGMYESWLESEINEIRKLFELNFFSVIEITKKFLPMIKENRGSVVNISSVAGKVHLPYMGAYSASKFALSAFSNSLRAELQEDGVNVLDVIVGRVDTSFSDSVFGAKRSPKTPFVDSPEVLAEKIFRAEQNRRREIVFPRWYSFMIFLSKLLPSLYDRESIKKWKEANG